MLRLSTSSFVNNLPSVADRFNTSKISADDEYMSASSASFPTVATTDFVNAGTTYSASCTFFKSIKSSSSNLVVVSPGDPLNPPPSKIFPGSIRSRFGARLSNCWSIYFLKPRPRAISNITDSTPIKIPRDVRSVRILFLAKLKSADLKKKIKVFILLFHL